MCDDIFGGVLDLESEFYEQGKEEGGKAAEEKIRENSIQEGRKYGLDIGNHLGYYKEIIQLMMKFKPEKFQNKK